MALVVIILFNFLTLNLSLVLNLDWLLRVALFQTVKLPLHLSKIIKLLFVYVLWGYQRPKLSN